MCIECRQNPCHAQCPNHEWKAKHTCCVCKDDLLPNEECYNLDGVYFHAECFAEVAVDILVKDYDAMKFIEEE